MVLETAVNGRADLLVTFNQQDFAAAAKGFAHETMRTSEALYRTRSKPMRQSSFPLRLASSLQEEAKRQPKAKGYP